MDFHSWAPIKVLIFSLLFKNCACLYVLDYLESDNSSINAQLEVLGNLVLRDYFTKNQCVVVISEIGNDLTHLEMSNSRIDLEIDSTVEDCKLRLHELLRETFKMNCDGYIVQLKDPTCAMDGWHETNKRKFVPRHNPKFFFLPLYPTTTIYADEIMSRRIADISQYILAGELELNTTEDWKVVLYTNNFYQHPLEEGREPKIYLDDWHHINGFTKNVNLYPDKIRDLNGKKFRISTGKYLPFAIDEPLDGMENRIARQFCVLHNCTPVALTDDTYWGTIYDNLTATGALGNPYADLADIGCFAVYTWLDESYYIDYSDSYLRGEVSVMIPKPKRIGGWMTPFMPFKIDLWIAFALSLVLSALSLYFVTKAAIKFTRFGEKLILKNQFTSLGDSWMRALGLSVLQQPSSRLIGDSPNRYLFTSFEFLYLVLSAMYGAELASFLTVPMFEPPIDTFHDFAASGITWYGTHIAWIYALTGSKDNDTLSVIDHFHVLSKEGLAAAAKEGKYGFTAERLPGGSVTEQPHITAEVIPMYHIMKDYLFGSPLVVSMKKGGPYNRYYNRLVNKVVEHGLSLYWEAETVRKFMDSRIQAEYSEAKTIHVDDSPQILRVENIIGVIYLFGIGMFLSFIIFVVEKFRAPTSPKISKD